MAPNYLSVVVWYESDFHFDIAIWAAAGSIHSDILLVFSS